VRRWEDNIKLGLSETVCEGADWIDVAQDGDQCLGAGNAMMQFGFPKMLRCA
jgi:hypothetical protein